MTSNGDEYELKGPDADAKGVLTDEGFLVKAGSLARRETVPSGKGVTSVHQRLIAEGVLETDGARLRFVKNHLFSTPSGAAAAVLGRTANGWISWKSSDGRTLSDVRRITRPEQAQMLSDRKRQEIVSRHRQLLNEGKLLPLQELDRQYSLFQDRFGPSVLSGLDGEPLLNLIHDHTNRDSLVYWLEFKNDDEFRSPWFGSIAGGSALKFRIFRRKETGRWQAADKSNYPVEIPVEQAVEMARAHRDQLLKGVELLDQLADVATDEDYAELQDQMDEFAPDVSRLAWGHKYFSLLFPKKLDDYHSADWQRFHFLKLLQLPPQGKGRYLCAGRFVTAASEVGLPMNHLTATLNVAHGRLHRYWRIGTRIGDSGPSYWPMIRDRSCVAVGWPALGDISWLDGKQEAREKLKSLLQEKYPSHHASLGRDCSQLVRFVIDIAEGDVVLAADGMTIVGVGRVVGGYEYHPEVEFPHQRQVEWLAADEWQLPEPNEGLRSTVRELGKFNENLLAIEQRIQSPPKPKPVGNGAEMLTKRPLRLTGVAGRIQSILERKGQVILYGPPGTGKTFWAERTAIDLAALCAFGKLFEQLDGAERAAVVGQGANAGLVRLCCFHPAYGYEDFIEGYRPQTVEGQISFELRDGVFKRLCNDAAASPDRNFYLIVDEINRGDIPRIFGELLTTLEKDKRGKRIVLPVSQDIFSVPRNVFVLGTMNTADRSISLLDAALRRRFGFVELMPDGGVLKDAVVEGIALSAWLDALNNRIREHVGRNARNLQIGHSYLMQGTVPVKDLTTLKRAIRDDIIPLLEEYCYEDYGALASILGERMVDVTVQRIRQQLFDDAGENALVDALNAFFEGLSTSSEVLPLDGSQAAPDDDETGDD